MFWKKKTETAPQPLKPESARLIEPVPSDFTMEVWEDYDGYYIYWPAKDLWRCYVYCRGYEWGSKQHRDRYPKGHRQSAIHEAKRLEEHEFEIALDVYNYKVKLQKEAAERATFVEKKVWR